MKVKNSNIFQIEGSPHMWHLGTIIDGMREYVAMVCLQGPKKGKVYIEEVVATSVDFSSDIFGNLRFIEDDLRAREVQLFFKEKGLLEIKERFEHMVRVGMLSTQDPLTRAEVEKLSKILAG